MESSCPLPERPDRPVMRPDPVWTLARAGADGRVDAVVTLFRGLPDGISQQVADRTSKRLPTDGNDPGTVLDPAYQAVEVRGTTGTLVERRPAVRFEATRVIWTEPSLGTWSLQSFHEPFPGWQDWRVLVRPGDRIVSVDGREALLSRETVTALLFDLPGGAQAGLSLRDATMEPMSSRAAVDELQAAAASLEPVPVDDPRLRGAIVEQ